MLRALFIWLSESKRLRAMAERSRMGQRMSRRFVAGETLEEALAATKATNDLGMAVSIDNLGENVTNAEEAKASAQLYHQLIEEMAKRKLNANVSLKLTHMGLDVDEKLAQQTVSDLVAHAARFNNFVRSLHSRNGNRGYVGAVIQSYLRRSEQDVLALCAQGIRIRLCKGAYKEPPEIAFQKKSEVDANYVKLMKIMLKSGVYHGIATHDEKMIRATLDFAKAEKIPPDSFEFQMLHGIRRDLQESLVRDGWRMRVYIPFGTEWYPYFMRRLAERPANVFFIAKNILRR